MLTSLATIFTLIWCLFFICRFLSLSLCALSLPSYGFSSSIEAVYFFLYFCLFFFCRRDAFLNKAWFHANMLPWNWNDFFVSLCNRDLHIVFSFHSLVSRILLRTIDITTAIKKLKVSWINQQTHQIHFK